MPRIHMQTDASPYGWGVVCPQLQLEASGHWSPSLGAAHITVLETLAAGYALELVVPRLPHTRVNLVATLRARCLRSRTRRTACDSLTQRENDYYGLLLQGRQ